MARIAGVELQDKWRIDYGLTKIKGIGFSRAFEILKNAGVEKSLRISKLSNEDLSKINTQLEKYEIEGDLIRTVKSNIQRLKVIGSYRGIRHNQSLPVRGQRTKSNSRTKRGARKTVGSFRKDE